MTRFARAGRIDKRIRHDASDWNELNNDNTQNSQSEKPGGSNQSQKRKWEKPGTSEGTQKRDATSVPRTLDQKRELGYKKAFRSEERRRKRVDQRLSEQVCFNCRQPGHKVNECVFLKDSVEHSTGICFKCGSSQHSINKCPVKLPPGEFPFAKCFICGESGHLSRQCSNNPRGLYPNGGGCRVCSSVDHLKRDCPQLLQEQGISSVTVSRISDATGIEEVISAPEPVILPKIKKKAPKVVKF